MKLVQYRRPNLRYRADLVRGAGVADVTEPEAGQESPDEEMDNPYDVEARCRIERNGAVIFEATQYLEAPAAF